jgi:hypothetical protein
MAAQAIMVCRGVPLCVAHVALSSQVFLHVPLCRSRIPVGPIRCPSVSSLSDAIKRNKLCRILC